MNKEDKFKLEMLEPAEVETTSNSDYERFTKLIQQLESQTAVPQKLDNQIKMAARQKKYPRRHWLHRVSLIIGSVGAMAAAWAVVLQMQTPVVELNPKQPPADTTALAVNELDEVDILLQQQQIFSEEMKIAIMIDDYLLLRAAE